MRSINLALILGILIHLNIFGQKVRSNEKNINPLQNTKRELLLNGLPIITLSHSGTNSVSISLAIKVGAIFDREGKEGLATLTARSLLAGIENSVEGKLDRSHIQQEIEEAKGSLNIKVDWDSTQLEIIGPANNTKIFLDILGNLVSRPKFNQDEVTQIKQEYLSEIEKKSSSEKIDALFNKALFDPHPYKHGIDGTVESVNSISRFDILDFYKRHYIANNAILVIVGSPSMSEVSISAKRSFGGWAKGIPAPYTFLSPSENKGIRIIFFPTQNQSQISLRLGNILDASKNREIWKITEKYFKKWFGNDEVIFTSQHFGYRSWMIKGTTSEEKILTALNTFLSNLQEIKKSTISMQEFITLKDSVLNNEKINLDNNSNLLQIILEYELYKTNSMELSKQIEKYNTTDLKNHIETLNEKQLLILVKGGRIETSKLLETFGKVEIRKL